MNVAMNIAFQRQTEDMVQTPCAQQSLACKLPPRFVKLQNIRFPHSRCWRETKVRAACNWHAHDAQSNGPDSRNTGQGTHYECGTIQSNLWPPLQIGRAF